MVQYKTNSREADGTVYKNLSKEEKEDELYNRRIIREAVEVLNGEYAKIKEEFTKIDNIYKKIKDFENKDDSYKRKASNHYREYASRGELAKSIDKNVTEAGKGFYFTTKEAVVGTAVLLCNPSQLVDFGKAIWKDPEGVIEGIGQNINDEYNRSSICYTVGAFVPDMALLVATKGAGTGAKTVVKASVKAIKGVKSVKSVSKPISKLKNKKYTGEKGPHQKRITRIGGQSSGEPKIGTDFGKNGKLVENPNTKIDWSKTSDHGTTRMNERGVTQEMAESWVKSGKALEQAGGSKHLFFTPDGTVVVATDGTVVTTIPRSL